MKVLIVDDKQDNIYMLESLFKGSGFDTLSAVNGAEALEVLKKAQVDIIISDILMPVMDGFQFCRKVKMKERTRKIPFVFYTATYTEKKDEELALKMGADRFVVKPAEPEEMLKIANDVIKEGREGKLAGRAPAKDQEEDLFVLYSERLVHKLEKRTQELEREIAERKRVEAELRDKIRSMEIMDRSTMGREERVLELKAEVKRLETELRKRA